MTETQNPENIIAEMERKHYDLLRHTNETGLANSMEKIRNYQKYVYDIFRQAESLPEEARLNIQTVCKERHWTWDIKRSFVTREVRHPEWVFGFPRTTV